jgi:hypothetical protein
MCAWMLDQTSIQLKLKPFERPIIHRTLGFQRARVSYVEVRTAAQSNQVR